MSETKHPIPAPKKSNDKAGQIQQESGVFEHLQTRHLDIVDKNGKTVACLCAADGGAGLWLNDSKGNMVAIHALDCGGVVVGFYDKKSTADSKGMTLALYLDADGPAVQIRNKDGEPCHISTEKLQSLA